MKRFRQQVALGFLFLVAWLVILQLFPRFGILVCLTVGGVWMGYNCGILAEWLLPDREEAKP